MTVTLKETSLQKLQAFIRAELDASVDPRVEAVACAIRDKLGDAVVAVLFYGSCLRTGSLEDKILDFYVIVESYEALWPNSRFLRVANQKIPPNVFYFETAVGGSEGPETIRTKYAVLSADHFEKLCDAATLNSSVWARFAQPARLLIPANDAVSDQLVKAVSNAVLTTVSETLPMLKPVFTPSELWTRAFSETYAVELRSEKQDKGQEIVALYQERYEELSPIVLGCFGLRVVDGGRYPKPDECLSVTAGLRRWKKRRFQGKILSVLRLIKAASTFDGGLDYLAWKISRHSGVPLVVTPWQRRHPVLAGIAMFWRLRRKGAFR